jgi:hypothetical protein
VGTSWWTKDCLSARGAKNRRLLFGVVLDDLCVDEEHDVFGDVRRVVGEALKMAG